MSPSTLDPNAFQFTLGETKTVTPFWKFSLLREIVQNTTKISPWVEPESLRGEFLLERMLRHFLNSFLISMAHLLFCRNAAHASFTCLCLGNY